MKAVLDASALLALLRQERGAEVVAQAIDAGAGASVANLAELVTVLVRDGFAPEAAIALASRLPIEPCDVDLDLALRAGAFIARTRPFGLSLGDRLCLALAAREGVPAVTADTARQNAAAQLGVVVTLIR